MKHKIIIVNSILLPITIILFMVIFVGKSTQTSSAKELGNMSFSIGYRKADRVEILRKFFAKYNSPLKENAVTFVAVADKYEIDYRLLPSIACVESTCAKNLIEGSYNPFGWGIPGDGSYITFESYDEAIEAVGEGLNKNYFSRGLDTVEEIEPVYTPPSNGSWRRNVKWFSGEIDKVSRAEAAEI